MSKEELIKRISVERKFIDMNHNKIDDLKNDILWLEIQICEAANREAELEEELEYLKEGESK